MSQLDAATVQHIAKLARIELDDTHTPTIQKELSSILDMVEQMQAVDTDGIQPMSHPMDATQRLRTDEVTEPNQRDALMANAPEQQDGLFIVPKVVE